MSFTVDTVEENNTLNNLLYLESLIDHCPVITQDFTETLSPYQALQLLKEGNARFVEDNSEDINSSSKRVYQLSDGQNPFATVFSCSDSRDSCPNVFNRGLGDIFEVSTAGETLYDNTSTTNISLQTVQSIEYAVSALSCPLLVIMGHTDCGALKHAYPYWEENTDPAPSTDDFYMLTNSLKNACKDPTSSNYDEAALNQTIDVKTYLSDPNNSKIISEALVTGNFAIEVAMYDVHTGIVTFGEMQTNI